MIVSQYIDEFGKSRARNYVEEISLITMPSPIIENVKESKQIYEASMKEVKLFMKKNSFIAQKQVLNSKGLVKGIWAVQASQANELVFIPVNGKDKMLKDVQVSTNDAMLLTTYINESETELEKYKTARKISYLLQENAIFLRAKNRAKLDHRDFKIMQDFDYDLTNYSLDLNSSFFDKQQRLIVPSKETAVRLINFVASVEVNNASLLRSYEKKNFVNVNTLLEEVSFFKSHEDEVIFTSPDEVCAWKKNTVLRKTRDVAYTKLNLTTREPYFYKAVSNSGMCCFIIQNVKDFSEKRALNVAFHWVKNRKNIGYDAEELNDEIYEAEIINKIQVKYVKNIEENLNEFSSTTINILRYTSIVFVPLLML